jgi:hypothetical protein
MRAVRIVMMYEGRQGTFETLLVQHQQPVETLRPNRSHEALRHPVGMGCPKRDPDDLDVFSPKHIVKALGDF